MDNYPTIEEVSRWSPDQLLNFAKQDAARENARSGRFIFPDHTFQIIADKMIHGACFLDCFDENALKIDLLDIPKDAFNWYLVDLRKRITDANANKLGSGSTLLKPKRKYPSPNYCPRK